MTVISSQNNVITEKKVHQLRSWQYFPHEKTEIKLFIVFYVNS